MERPKAARGTLAIAAASGTITLAIVTVLAWPAARLDFFFDEMWRVEQVRSSTPIAAYLEGTTPIPPGWILALWSVFEVVPPRRPLLRAAAVGFAIPAVIALSVALRTVLRRVFDEVGASVVAIGSALMVLTSTAIAAHAVYFNNYFADLTVAASLLLLLARIDLEQADDDATWFAVVVLAVAAPWLAQSALFLAPVAAAILFLNRSLRPRLALASAVSLIISSSIVGFRFLLPTVRNGTIEDYWFSDTPQAGLEAIARRFGSSFVQGAYPSWVEGRPLVTVAALITTAAGLVILQRCWRWWLPLTFGAQFVALVASVTVSWPATFVRVNTGFHLMIYVAAPVAVITVALVVVRRASAKIGVLVAAVLGAAIGVAIGVAWWPIDVRSNSTSTTVFARGLSDDLRLVADQAEPGDLIVAYHLSGPYVRDRLLNDDGVAPGIRVVDEALDPAVLDDLNSVLPSGADAVWCVIPYEAGPDASGRACALNTRWVETLSTRLTRAEVVRFQRRE